MLKTDSWRLLVQVHIRRGRPLERFLFQTAEVVVTAAAVCMITLASNHIRHKGSSKRLAVKESKKRMAPAQNEAVQCNAMVANRQ